MDIQKAMLDPAGFFRSPDDVVNEPSLTREQKIEMLRRWEYDARELLVAEEENMTGGPPNLLDEVLTALRRLDAEPGSQPSPPTKQGGA